MRLLVLICILSCWAHTALAIPNDTAPVAGLSFQTASDSSAKLEDFHGSTVLLHFMASWCGECILEAPSLNTLARSLSSDGVTVVGVLIDDHPQAAKALAQRLKIAYPLLVDSARRLKTFFEIRGVPVTYLLGADGKILEFTDPQTGRATRRITGPRQWDSAAALGAVREAATPAVKRHLISDR